MFNNKDEYKEATEHASINTHRVIKNRGYKLGIFNLFLLTTIGVMGYVGFDSLNKESSFFKNINILNTDRTASSDSDAEKELLKLLGNVPVENEIKSISLSSAINSVVNDSHQEENSLYREALSREINREQN